MDSEQSKIDKEWFDLKVAQAEWEDEQLEAARHPQGPAKPIKPQHPTLQDINGKIPHDVEDYSNITISSSGTDDALKNSGASSYEIQRHRDLIDACNQGKCHAKRSQDLDDPSKYAIYVGG
jgi:hypothetical protein